MTTYVALLRGINVGKAKRVSMADLRRLLVDLGYENVATILMSGNAVFTTASARNEAALAKEIEAAIERRLTMDVRVFVRGVAKVRKAVDGNPFPEHASKDPSRLAIAFFDGRLDRKVLAPILEADWSPEAFAVGTGVTYAWHPNGVTGSPLAEALVRTKGLPVGTSRNLATITKVLHRSDALD